VEQWRAPLGHGSSSCVAAAAARGPSGRKSLLPRPPTRMIVS